MPPSRERPTTRTANWGCCTIGRISIGRRRRPPRRLDWVKLDDLQQKFTQFHTTAEMQAMHGAVSNAEVKIPFLQLYHKTIDQYRSFQQTAASQVGMPLSALRQQTTEYGALYGNQAASGRYLFSHPKLAEYERLKKTWETQTTAGLLYGMLSLPR